ncbi:hypothetical protein ACXNAM_17080 [Kluyvera cryocrescens]|nr:hypothetical protein [Kluyvera cryocrescens]
MMNKSLVGIAVAIAAAMSFGIWFSAGRIASCDGNNRATAACLGEAWDAEKVNLIPQYDPNRYVSDPTADSIFSPSQLKR